MPRNSNPNQIIRKDGNKCFVEVLTNSFPIGRVQFKFVTYDTTREAGDRFTNQVDIYFTFAEFLRLAYDILDSQKIIKELMVEKKRTQEESARTGRTVYAKQKIIHMGGISAQVLASRGKSRPDGMGVSRVLKIFPGIKLPFMFQAELGAGQADEKGLIVPRYGTNPEQIVRIGFDADGIKELFLMTRERVRAYLAAKEMYDMMNPPQNFYRQGSTSNQNTTQNNYQSRPQQSTPTQQNPPAPKTTPQSTATSQQVEMTPPEDFDIGFSEDMFGNGEDFFGLG